MISEDKKTLAFLARRVGALERKVESLEENVNSLEEVVHLQTSLIDTVVQNQQTFIGFCERLMIKINACHHSIIEHDGKFLPLLEDK